MEAESNAETSVMIKKCSIFDYKQSKPLLESIKEIVEGFHDDESSTISKIKPQNETNVNDVQIQLIDIESIKNITISDKLFCSTCNQAFNNREEQIEHYKCDLHLFNMKQKLKGKSPITADEFEQLTDISSISGSDTEGENKMSSESSTEDESTCKNYVRVARNKPKISFRLEDSTILVMQRCVLHGKKNFPDDQKAILNIVKSTTPDDYWSIILVAAGHFAAVIFKGDTVVTHKTFHRYVVRAKRGTVQSQHDSSGKHAKSAGANIRRSQEAAFKDDIRILLGSQWKADLDKCKCIFIRVPTYNRHVLISSTNQFAANIAIQNVAPFSKDDLRLRHIPFMTFRPTFNEVKRAHTLLSRLELYNESYLTKITKFNKSPAVEPVIKKTNEKKKMKIKLDSSKTEENKAKELIKENVKDEEEIEEEENEEQIGPECNTTQNDFIQCLQGDELKMFNELYTACFTNNVNKLKQLLETTSTEKSNIENENKAILNEKLINKRLNKEKGYTLLHLTSQLGYSECVWYLLMNGADPALADLTSQRRLPFFIASSKQTRDQYRRFMSEFPTRYDYKAAKIPSPLSQEKIDEKAEKEREKKRNQRKQKKLRETQNKQVEKQQEVEEKEKQRFLSLTDQEKRRLIIDRNCFNVLPLNSNDDTTDKSKVKFTPAEIKVISRCWTCASDMSTSVPFEYFDYKFCSTKCLKVHRENQKQMPSKF